MQPFRRRFDAVARTDACEPSPVPRTLAAERREGLSSMCFSKASFRCWVWNEENCKTQAAPETRSGATELCVCSEELTGALRLCLTCHAYGLARTGVVGFQGHVDQ